MIDADEISRRIKAARELRGINQVDLGAMFDAEGLNSSDPGRLERGDIEMRAAHRYALMRCLRVPERWFTEPDVDAIVGWEDAETVSDAVSQLENQVRLMRAEIAAVAAAALRRTEE